MRRRISSLLGLIILTAATLAPSGPRALAAGREPVIMIPGIGGSELAATSAFHLDVGDGHGGRYIHDYSAGETVWVNVGAAAWIGDDDYFDALKLRADGVTPVAPQLAVSGIYRSVYGDLVDYLQRQGYVEGRDLWLFAFDWRRDIRETVKRLDGYVTTALIAANGNRTDPRTWTVTHVDIVAHSMGGLVGRYYVSDPVRARRVDQLLTLGSPQLGAAGFLKTLLYGDDFGSTVFGLGLNPEEVRDVIQNMPGGMELLPSRSYYSFYDNSDDAHRSPFRADLDGDGDGKVDGPLGYSGVERMLLRKNVNPTVLRMAQQFQGSFDGLRVMLPLIKSAATTGTPPGGRSGGLNGVRWHALIGHGFGTLGQVREYTGLCDGTPCTLHDELTVDGDGTVGLFSAAMGDVDRGRAFTGAALRDYVERTHSGMLQRDYAGPIPIGDGPGLLWIGEQLRGDAASGASAGAEAAPARGLRGLAVAALGPVALRVSDAEGHATGRFRGQDERIPEAIPDSIYDRLPDGEFVFLKRDMPYTFALDAERAGSVDLKLRLIEDGAIVRTVVFIDVHLDAGGHARLALPPGGLSAASAPALAIDAGGDGVFESTLAPSAVLDAQAGADTTPPEIALVAPQPSSAAAPGLALRWSATDGGAGLLRSWAVVDPGPAARRAENGASVVLAPGRHRLLVVAQDRAGNASSRTLEFSAP
jgi:hypothetical protein